MCYLVTNSGEGAFSRTGAFNFVKREILKVPTKVLINQEVAMSFFREDGNQLFLIKPEDETQAIGSALRLKELNEHYFKAKTDGRSTEASRMLHDILLKLENAMKNSKQKSPYFVK